MRRWPATIVAEVEWLSQRGVEAIDRGQVGVGKPKQAGPRARRVVGVRLERGDRDVHPAAKRQGAEQIVELSWAVGAVQTDGLALPWCDGRPPQPYEMPLASQVGGGGGLGACALFDLGLRRPVWNVELELNQELHDALLPAGQLASTQLRQQLELRLDVFMRRTVAHRQCRRWAKR